MPYADVIRQLRDIHLPEPVVFFPPPVGWWLLAGLVAGGLVGSVFFMRRHLRRIQRSALRELSALELAYIREKDVHGMASALSCLLKRFALAQFPADAVAPLYGESWLVFLDKAGGTERFCHGAGRNLLVWPYRKVEDGNMDELFELVRCWIENHPYRRRRRLA